MLRKACTTSILAYESFLEYFDLNATTIGAFGAAYYAGAVVGMVRRAMGDSNRYIN
jgi:hypothetical protein